MLVTRTVKIFEDGLEPEEHIIPLYMDMNYIYRLTGRFHIYFCQVNLADSELSVSYMTCILGNGVQGGVWFQTPPYLLVL